MSKRILSTGRPRARHFAVCLQFAHTLNVFTGVFALLALGPLSRAHAELEAELKRLMESAPHSQARAAACVWDLEADRPVFGFHAFQPMTPASVAKLWTMAVALDLLGEDFTFTTTLVIKERHIAVIGEGDPSFGPPPTASLNENPRLEPLAEWSRKLLEAGISKPDLLLLDDTLFDREYFHPSWEAEDRARDFGAPIGGLNLCDNCVMITIKPRWQASDLETWMTRPPNRMVRLVRDPRGNSTPEPLLFHVFDGLEYRVAGSSSKTWTFAPLSFPDPTLLFAEAFRFELARGGVGVPQRVLQGSVESIAPRSEWTRVAEFHTPLRDVLFRMGRESHNLSAEAVFKRLGAQRGPHSSTLGSPTPESSTLVQETSTRATPREPSNSDGRTRFISTVEQAPPDDPCSSVDQRPESSAKGAEHSIRQGSWATGRQAVWATLKRAGLDLEGMEIADGSGLSRSNRASPWHLIQILRWMDQHPNGALFAEALAEPDGPGTLHNMSAELSGFVRAKSGTMSGVRALAGYMVDGGRRRFAFAILFEGFPGTTQPYRELQERFLRVLANRIRTQTGVADDQSASLIGAGRG